MEPEQVNRRRVVLHPRTAMVRRQDRARSFGGHVRGHTVNTGEVLELMRQQRRTSIRSLLTVVLPLIAFALALNFFPALGSWRPLGLLPLPWLVLGPIVLFSIIALAFFHERRANAIERDWSERHHADQRRDSEAPR